jgi:hypothetical protein
MKHTPEPWKLEKQYEADRSYTYKIVQEKEGYYPIIPCSNFSENFARIVACVNACAGMEDPEAVMNMMRSVTLSIDGNPNFGKVLQEMERLKAANDKLLTALEAFATDFERHERNEDHDPDAVYIIAKDAIAKAKGQTP